MTDRPNLLDTEKALQELLEELRKIKSASEQVDQLKETSLVIQKSSEEVVEKLGEVIASVADVVGASSRVVTEIESAELPKKLALLISSSQTFYDDFERRDRRATIFRIVLIGLLLLNFISMTIGFGLLVSL